MWKRLLRIDTQVKTAKELYMTLLSLLIVMALERTTSKNPKWHIHAITLNYAALLEKRGLSTGTSSFMQQILFALVPAVLSFWLLIYADSLLLTLFLNLLVLWVCLGCPVTRKNYKQYLKAAEDGDMQACSLHSMSFGNAGGDLNKVADQLVFINYRQYAAVLIWFVVFGVPGVIFYSLLKEFQSITTPSVNCAGDQSISLDEPQVLASKLTNLDRFMYIIDWLPIRLTGLGFLIVGHFSRATSVWVSSLFNFNKSSKLTLAEIAAAAEDVDAGVDDCLSKPCTMVRLVKRNVSFLLVAVAILTMVGAVN
jgi:AmpE protein